MLCWFSFLPYLSSSYVSTLDIWISSRSFSSSFFLTTDYPLSHQNALMLLSRRMPSFPNVNLMQRVHHTPPQVAEIGGLLQELDTSVNCWKQGKSYISMLLLPRASSHLWKRRCHCLLVGMEDGFWDLE